PSWTGWRGARSPMSAPWKGASACLGSVGVGWVRLDSVVYRLYSTMRACDSLHRVLPGAFAPSALARGSGGLPAGGGAMDASADATTSGDRFRGQVLLLRGRAGLTQRALAAHLGISEQAIQKWEAGQGYPSPARLQALIALYLERGVFTAGREGEE